MQDTTDEQLMNQIMQGKYEACSVLYDRYGKMLMGYFFNITRNRNNSEDLVQATFEKIIRYKHNYDEKHSFKSWVFSIARNVHIDHYRKNKKSATDALDKVYQDFGHEDHGERMLIEKEKYESMYRAIGMLDPDKRELITMVKLNEMKYKDVARIVGLTEGNLKVKIFRITKELRSLIEKMQANEK